MRPPGEDWSASGLLQAGRTLDGSLKLAAAFRRAGSWLLLSLMLVAAGAARGADTLDREQEVRYLLTFTEYVEWPAGAFPSSEAPLVIGMIGEDPFGEVLTKQAAGHRGRRPVEVRHFKSFMEFRGQETPGRRNRELDDKIASKNRELRGCHVLYISRSEDPFLPQVIRAVRGGSVLTVGDKPAFTRQGGVIGFYQDVRDAQLRFEINLAAAERAKLKLSSKLLALAKVITKGDAQAKP